LRATYTNAFLLNAKTDLYLSDYDFTLGTLNFGIGAGLGVKYSVGDAGYGILKCEYEYRGSYSKSYNIYDYMNANSLLLVVGYGFKL
jgi:hypothetical protein